MKNNGILSLIFVILIMYQSDLMSKDKPLGILAGRVIDRETKRVIPQVQVFFEQLEIGTSSDEEGNFLLRAVPVGSYTVSFQIIGYRSQVKPDIIIRPDRTTYVNTELIRQPVMIEGIKATTGEYFSEREDQPLSSISFSGEEIRRSPGTGSDVSRIIMSLPGVAKLDDSRNHLVVRGGSPLENGFIVDNIQVPNINHFPVRGTSGGAIGILNIDFIESVDFSSGGFSPVYGDRLSSMMNISFREGSRTGIETQLDLNFSGFGGVIEGPLSSQRGSWMLAVKRSYLDFVVDWFDLGTTIAPVYGDIQGKVLYDLDQSNRLSCLFIASDDHSESTEKVAQENDMIFFGKQDYLNATSGINWRYLWGSSGFSNTSISVSYSSTDETAFETGTAAEISEIEMEEVSYQFRNINHFKLTDHNSLEFGLEGKVYDNKYGNYYAEYVDVYGDSVDSISQLEQVLTSQAACFFNHIFKPLSALRTILGFRAGYYDYNEKIVFSPRFAILLELGDRFSLRAAAGLYHQNLPLLLLTQNSGNRDLEVPRCLQYILGGDYLITDETRVGLEIYYKDYSRLPLDPDQPDLFVLDELYYGSGYYGGHRQLLDKGKARSYGLELVLQKKLARGFYGLANAALFRSEYRDLNGRWHNRVYDNRWIAGIEGGYKPGSEWELSLRWLYAGGAPYTPFDLELSQEFNHGIIDTGRINQARYPDYHSLNLRFDRRFHYTGSSLIVYISIWNVYNRKNIAQFYWNKSENRQDEIYQWSLLPIFGLEFEF